MIRRPRRTVPAALTAVVLLAVCVAVVVSLIQRLTGSPEYLSYDTVAREMNAVSWDDAVVPVVAVVALVIGALLLASALLPGRTQLLPLPARGDDTDGIDTGVHRGDLRTLLRGAANSVHGVHSARVKIRRDTVAVRARTDRHDRAGLAEEICTVLGARARQAGRPVGTVRARVRGPKPTARDRRDGRVSPRTLRRTTGGLAPAPEAAATDRGAPWDRRAAS